MLNPDSNNYQYLFLGGILGEVLALPFIGNYLKENESILKDFGIDHYESMTLNSYHSAHKNADKLKSIILDLVAKNKKQLVVIGHSKACLEIILCLKDNFSLFEKHVHKVICVQPPFQGSALLKDYKVFEPLKAIWPGLRSLSKNEYTAVFDQDLNHEIIRNYLKDNLLVIRGHKPKLRDVAWIMKPSHFYLSKLGIQNDGLVDLEDQRIPFVDYQDRLVEMDHSDLFTSSLLSNHPKAFRSGMMMDLMNWATVH